MNSWTANEIKNLRLRLGWSAAEFSRHVGCLSEIILDWEKGAKSPSPDDVLQLKRLEFHSESYCEQVIRDSEADRAFKSLSLEQICQTDIRHLNS
jgi:transcriptional regulator with XRE-family HTH domain